MELELLRELAQATPSRIVLLVLDGLGGLPHPESGKTELETAATPNLDRLARESVGGLAEPVGPGITPGSGPAHLALFGYDPFRYPVGRGVLEALGVGFPLEEGDVAARGNFCTVDSQGMVVDRRAGRLADEDCRRLSPLLDKMPLEGGSVAVVPSKEHRFVAIFRGKGLSPELSESDPQRDGLPPGEIKALSPGAEATARLVRSFVARAREVLRSFSPANMVLLRGFAQLPRLPQMREVFQLRAAAIAAYPMYRGLARLVGMTPLPTGETIQEEFTTLADHYQEFDYFFVHIKGCDTAGEDGDFARKVRVIEEVDAALPQVLALRPEVLMVTGDHSTPALLKSHSWHPVPFLLHAATSRRDDLKGFSERECARGSLGRFPATATMPLALGHALKLARYGA